MGRLLNADQATTTPIPGRLERAASAVPADISAAPAAPAVIPGRLERQNGPVNLGTYQGVQIGKGDLTNTPDYVPPGGFVGRMAKAAFDSVKGSFDSLVNSGTDILMHSGNPEYPFKDNYASPTFETEGMTPEQRKKYYEDKLKEYSYGAKVGRAVNLGVDIASLYPAWQLLSAELAAGKELPGVLSYLPTKVSEAIGKLGDAGMYLTGKAVDNLPISDEEKNNIRPALEKAGAFTIQIIAAKLGFKLAETGGAKIVSRLPVSENVKSNIVKGTKMAVGYSMNPFSTAYGLVSGKISAKIEERKAEGKKITPEESDKIVEEIKKELPSDMEKMKTEEPTTTDSVPELKTTRDALIAEQTKLQEQLAVETTKPDQTVAVDVAKQVSDISKKIDEVNNRLAKVEASTAVSQEKVNLTNPAPKAPEITAPEAPKVNTDAKIEAKDVKRLPIEKISSGLDPEIETKINVNDPKIQEMVKIIRSGKDLPEVPVHQKADGSFELNKDGAHRLVAYRAAGVSDIPVRVEAKTDLSSTAKQRTERAKVEAAKNTPEAKADEKLKSRTYERLQAEHPEILTEDTPYDQLKLKEQADKAVELATTDKEKLYRIAVGSEVSPEITQTAANIVLAEKALADGNRDLYATLVKNRSLANTRRGQEIVSEKGSVSDNSTARYVKELISAKMSALGKSYLGTLKEYNPLKKKSTDVQKASDIIQKEVMKAKEKVNTKEMDLKEAQSFLDRLTCK